MRLSWLDIFKILHALDRLDLLRGEPGNYEPLTDNEVREIEEEYQDALHGRQIPPGETDRSDP